MGLYLKVTDWTYRSKYADDLGIFALTYKIGEVTTPLVGGIYTYRSAKFMPEYNEDTRLLVVEGDEMELSKVLRLNLERKHTNRKLDIKTMALFWKWCVSGRTRSRWLKTYYLEFGTPPAILSWCKPIREITQFRNGHSTPIWTYDLQYMESVGFKDLYPQ